MKPFTAALLAACVLAAPAHGAQQDDQYDMQFTLKGCTRDWPPYTAIKPIIAHRKEQGREVYHIKDPVDCGLAVRNPGYRLDGTTLTMWYEVYADGPVAACFCEYNSEFSFKGLPPGNLKAAFQSRHVRDH